MRFVKRAAGLERTADLRHKSGWRNTALSHVLRGGLSLLLAASLLPACGLAEGGSGFVQEPCLQMSGSKLLAGEMALLDSRFAVFAPQTDLGYLPAPGERRTLALPGGGMACIERATHILSESEIASALELPTDATVSATVLTFLQSPVPGGVLRFPAGGVSPPPRGADAVLWRGTLEYEPGRTVAVWAQVALRREGGCLQASHDVARGYRWPAGNAKSLPCDAAAILASALREESQAAGLTAVRPIRPGEWLTPALLTEPPLVLARREASLELRSGAVRLVVPVVPEETGGQGERIWVRTVATRERLRAQVIGPDTLVLSLRGHEPHRAAFAPAAVVQGRGPGTSTRTTSGLEAASNASSSPNLRRIK